MPQRLHFNKKWLEGAHWAARVLRRDVAHASPLQIRQALELASKLNPGPWAGEFTERQSPTWSGAEVTWKEQSEGTIVWVHGGAFAFGSARVYRAAAVHLARSSRCRILLPEYRMAPEHGYPAAHDDVDRALQGIAKEHENVVLVGDSAGGNLVLGVMQRHANDPSFLRSISGVALLSPWWDLRPNAQSILSNQIEHSPFDDQDSLQYSRSYLGQADATAVDVHVLSQPNFEGWPPVFMEWSNDEFLQPDMDILRTAFDAAGLELTVRVEDMAVHGWQVLPDLLPEAKRSSQSLGEWARKCLGLTS